VDRPGTLTVRYFVVNSGDAGVPLEKADYANGHLTTSSIGRGFAPPLSWDIVRTRGASASETAEVFGSARADGASLPEGERLRQQTSASPGGSSGAESSASSR